MQKLPKKFAEVLHPCALAECRDGPLLGAVGGEMRFEIPQRVFRRPRYRYVNGTRDLSAVARPPLLRLLSARNSAADTCVRLYLWMWATQAARAFNPSPIRYRSSQWAVLLNLLGDAELHDPKRRPNAVRRVSNALHLLESVDLVRRVGRDQVRLVEPGTDLDYQPWTNEERLRRQERRDALERMWGDSFDPRQADEVWEDEPLNVPAALWINGTISALSAPALAVLVVLLDQERLMGTPHGPPVDGDGIIRLRKSRIVEYPIPHQAWSDGTKELTALKCIRPIKGATFYKATGQEPRLNTDLHLVHWKINHRRLERHEEAQW